jgi:hypothetical protein
MVGSPWNRSGVKEMVNSALKMSIRSGVEFAPFMIRRAVEAHPHGSFRQVFLVHRPRRATAPSTRRRILDSVVEGPTSNP